MKYIIFNNGYKWILKRYRLSQIRKFEEHQITFNAFKKNLINIKY